MYGTLFQVREEVSQSDTLPSLQLLPFFCQEGSRKSVSSIFMNSNDFARFLMKAGSRIKELISPKVLIDHKRNISKQSPSINNQLDVSIIPCIMYNTL